MRDRIKKLRKPLSLLAFALVAATLFGAAFAGSGQGSEDAAPRQAETSARPEAAPKADAKAQTTQNANAKAQSDAARQDANAKTQGGAAKQDAEPAAQKKPAFVVAKEDFSNLQLDDPTKPVYDRYTVEQRLALGLPLALPEIAPRTGQKIAYLTFDDGPDPTITPQILDILADEGVPATFYVLGAYAEAYPELIKRIFNDGHAIGGHSYNHDYDALYPSVNEFLWQAGRTDEAIHAILGVRPLILRAPGGAMGMFEDDYWDALKASGYVEHDWNVCTNDATPEQPDAAAQLAYVDAQTSHELKDDMALVLMHSTYGKQETVNALRSIIQLLRERGFAFGVVTPMTPQPY